MVRFALFLLYIFINFLNIIMFILFFPGVIPPHQQSHDFVMLQRNQQYNDLKEALVAMRKVDDRTPLAEAHLKMFLIEDSILPFDEQKMVGNVVYYYHLGGHYL